MKRITLVHTRLKLKLLIIISSFFYQIAFSQTKEDVLHYISLLPSQEKVLIGQHCGDGNNINNWAYVAFVMQLHKESGKWVGMVGGDYGWKEETDPLIVNESLKKHASYGGLVEVTWHARNPWTGGDVRDNMINYKMSELVTPSGENDSTVYDKWITELDKVATGLQDLKNEGIVVFWRPLHEMNGGWFWWGKKTQEGFITVWRHMYNYLTNEKGLDNLIWVYSVSPTAEYAKDIMLYYPGDDYVDIVGEDIYDPDSSPTGYERLIAETGKPYALAEYGPNVNGGVSNLNTLSNLRGKASYWLQWHTWDNSLPTAIIDNPKANEVMNHTDVITADEITYDELSNYDLEKPDAPVIETAEINDHSVIIKWNEPYDNTGIAGYYILKDGIYEQTVTDTFAVVTGLANNSEYSFTVRAFDGNRNISDKSEGLIVRTTITGIGNKKASDITVFPNPASDFITVSLTQDFRGTIEIYNNIGLLMTKKTNDSGTTRLDISHLDGGVYLLLIKDKETLYTQKFIKH